MKGTFVTSQVGKEGMPPLFLRYETGPNKMRPLKVVRATWGQEERGRALLPDLRGNRGSFDTQDIDYKSDYLRGKVHFYTSTLFTNVTEVCRGVPPWAPAPSGKNGAPTEGRPYNN